MCAVLLCLPQVLLAWGAEGHRLVAALAQEQLNPTARLRVQELLALEGMNQLADVSTWADEHRNPVTAPWHYINFPRDTCAYDAERDCPDGRCVVAAVERQTEVLLRAKDAAPSLKELQALKYVVHLSADVFQPLHAGYADDRGGNSVQLQAFMAGSNLHALWDTGIIRYLDEARPVWRAQVQTALNALPAAREWSPALAASHSCSIVARADFYPPRRVGLDYVEQFAPILQGQLAQAARGLADLLNGLWP